MSDRRVLLEILGISYSPLQRDAFALILAEVNGPYRIPIVIGASEAQSIAIRIEGIVTPRPMTHDLFAGFMHAFGVELQEVFIYRFEDGIFSAELTFTDGMRTVKCDSRTSDAIAIAIRTGAPIYTTEEILHRTGTIFDVEKDDGQSTEHLPDNPSSRETPDNDYESMTLDDLQSELTKAIDEENYEEAARINNIIKKKDNRDQE